MLNLVLGRGSQVGPVLTGDPQVSAVTFTGSVVAFMKLSGRMSGAPIILPNRHLINLGLAAALLGDPELRARRLIPAGPTSNGKSLEVAIEIRLYREKPELARHPKPAALALWAFEFGKDIAGLDSGTKEELVRLRADAAELDRLERLFQRILVIAAAFVV